MYIYACIQCVCVKRARVPPCSSVRDASELFHRRRHTPQLHNCPSLLLHWKHVQRNLLMATVSRSEVQFHLYSSISHITTLPRVGDLHSEYLIWPPLSFYILQSDEMETPPLKKEMKSNRCHVCWIGIDLQQQEKYSVHPLTSHLSLSDTNLDACAQPIRAHQLNTNRPSPIKIQQLPFLAFLLLFDTKDHFVYNKAIVGSVLAGTAQMLRWPCIDTFYFSLLGFCPVNLKQMVNIYHAVYMMIASFWLSESVERPWLIEVAAVMPGGEKMKHSSTAQHKQK